MSWWNWVEQNADGLTAIAAIFGLLLAAFLGYLAIHVSVRANRAEQTDREDTALMEVLDRLTFFQEPASLPFWKEVPPEGDSELAQVHHEAFASLRSATDALGQLQLARLRMQLEDVTSAAGAHYLAALPDPEMQALNPWDALRRCLAGFGMDDEGRIDELSNQVRTTYPENDVTLLQLTSACIDETRQALIDAYAKTNRNRR